jgi:hypothetical protein
MCRRAPPGPRLVPPTTHASPHGVPTVRRSAGFLRWCNERRLSVPALRGSDPGHDRPPGVGSTRVARQARTRARALYASTNRL